MTTLPQCGTGRQALAADALVRQIAVRHAGAMMPQRGGFGAPDHRWLPGAAQLGQVAPDQADLRQRPGQRLRPLHEGADVFVAVQPFDHRLRRDAGQLALPLADQVRRRRTISVT
jgi:hypothetical protein